MKKFSNVTEVQSEIIQLWETAWEKQPTVKTPFIIPCEDNKQAASLRQRLYSARKRLLREQYHGVSNWGKLEIRLEDGASELTIVIPPWIFATREAITKAGGSIVPLIPPREEVVTIEHGNISNDNDNDEGEALRRMFNVGGREDG